MRIVEEATTNSFHTEVDVSVSITLAKRNAQAERHWGACTSHRCLVSAVSPRSADGLYAKSDSSQTLYESIHFIPLVLPPFLRVLEVTPSCNQIRKGRRLFLKVGDPLSVCIAD